MVQCVIDWVYIPLPPPKRRWRRRASVHHAPRLLFMKRLFWNDIHHLLGFPVPSAYNFSTKRAASSCRTCVRYWRRYSKWEKIERISEKRFYYFIIENHGSGGRRDGSLFEIKWETIIIIATSTQHLPRSNQTKKKKILKKHSPPSALLAGGA